MKMPSGNDGIELPATLHSTESPNRNRKMNLKPDLYLLIGFGHKVHN